MERNNMQLVLCGVVERSGVREEKEVVESLSFESKVVYI